MGNERGYALTTSTVKSLPRPWVMKLVVAGVFMLVLVIGSACGASTSEGETQAPAATTAPTSGGAPSADAEAGQKIAQTNCFTCHSTDGRVIVGPSWQGLYGSTVELESGKTVTADDAYIKESIEDPSAKVVKGFPAAMPTFKGVLSDQQISQIIAYIKTLQE